MSKKNQPCLNSTGYKFVDIDSPNEVFKEISKICEDNKVFGTIYLAKEGININLAGPEDKIIDIESFFESKLRYFWN